MIQPDEFLTQAESWVQGPNEADWRSAVSRAYYAAFHVGRDLFTDLGFRVARGSSAHAYLWMRLSNTGDRTIDNAGAELNDLLRRRNQADHDIHQTSNQTSVQALVGTARLGDPTIAPGGPGSGSVEGHHRDPRLRTHRPAQRDLARPLIHRPRLRLHLTARRACGMYMLHGPPRASPEPES